MSKPSDVVVLSMPAQRRISSLSVRGIGYQPTALDLAELSSKPATNTVEKGIAKEREAAAAQSAHASASKTADPAPSPDLAAKARAFEKEKPGFVMKKFPELAQAYGVVDAAKKFAEANLRQDVY